MTKNKTRVWDGYALIIPETQYLPAVLLCASLFKIEKGSTIYKMFDKITKKKVIPVKIIGETKCLSLKK